MIRRLRQGPGAPLLVLLLAAGASAAPPAAPWWNAAWPYRVQIDCPAGEGNVAAATVTLAGRTTPDGRDLRLIDEGGRLRNFEILHHDSKLATTLRMAAPRGTALTAWLYYGHPKAQPIDSLRIAGIPSRAAAETHAKWRRAQADREAALERQSDLAAQLAKLRDQQAAVNRAGNAPPLVRQQLQQAVEALEGQLKALPIPPELPEPEDPTHWNPQSGLLLRVYRKAKPGCPKTLEELKKMIPQSTLEGGGFRAGVSDGFNPFGTSDEYISVYTGFLRIEQPGEYAFCSASDEGSWIVVNGQTLLDWPGPHGWERAGRGQKHGRIRLEPGVALVEYYHEEARDAQLAFMGWKPPGAEGFTAIPSGQWIRVRQATANQYEARGRPLIAVPAASVVSTYWIRETDNHQATVVEFADHSRSTTGRIVEQRWSFGDGLRGRGQPVRHLYFRVYRPVVELTVRDADGNTDTVAFSPNIYQFDVQSNAFAYGSAAQYARFAARYDLARMERDDLEAYVEFCGQIEDWARLAPAADAYIRRFPDSPAVARLAGVAAEAYARPESYNPWLADKLLAQALSGAGEEPARRDLLMKRARLLAWDLADYDAAAWAYEELLKLAAGIKGTEGRELARRCALGLGDVALLSGDAAKAADLYTQARNEARRKIDKPEELAKTGSYPYSVDDLLARGEYEWAVKTIDTWEDEFPEQKLHGLTFFLRGKVLFVQHPNELALRYLALSEQVTPRGLHVPEALWLHANCLMALGRHADALKDLQRIRSDFTQTEFFTKAAAKIAECEQKVTATRPATGLGR